MNQEDFDAFIAYGDDQKDARLAGRMDHAYDLLDQMAARLNKYQASEVTKQRSRYFYEYGMTLSVDGQPNSAAQMFVASAEAAGSIDDKLRCSVGHFRHALTLFLGLQKEAAETYEFFKSQKSLWPTIADVPAGDINFRNGSELNLTKRLMETAFESGSTEFPQRLIDLVSHDRVAEGLRGNSAPHVHMFAYAKSLQALHLGNFAEAAAIYSVMLGVHVPSLPPTPDIKNLELVRNFGDERSEELARDYLFMGRALMKSDIPDAKAHAKSVWEKGMKLDPIRGNWRYLRDMQAELDALAVAV